MYTFFSTLQTFTKAQFCYVVGILTISALLSAALYNNTCFYISDTVSQTLSYLILTLTMMQFTTFNRILLIGLNCLNERVTKMVMQSHAQYFNSSTYNFIRINQLKHICRLHWEIANVAQIVNNMANEQLLLVILRSLVDFLNTFYSILKRDGTFSIFDIYWGVVAVTDLAFLIVPSRATMKAVSINISCVYSL